MFRIAPFRQRHGGVESLMPQVFDDFFNWPKVSWQGFRVDVKETPEGYAYKQIYRGGF